MMEITILFAGDYEKSTKRSGGCRAGGEERAKQEAFHPI
jgi:hypothetical protein